MSPGPATEEAGVPPAPPASEAERFGPNTGEVAAFVEAVARLTGAQWRKVISARRQAALIVKDTSAPPADAVRSMLGGGEGSPPPGPAANLAAALAPGLAGRGDEELVAAWQAGSALLRRRQLAALTFAAHYAPFAAVVPLAAGAEPPSDLQRFVKLLRWLGPEQWQAIGRPWSLEREVSAGLMQASAKTSTREAEEGAALAAIAAAPRHLPGDAGWAAVKTIAHGSRVLACRPELSSEQLVALWAPLEAAIPLRSLDEQPAAERRPRRASASTEKPAAPKKRLPVKRGPLYGANHTDVAAFIKAVLALTPIQWLRVLDRRQLVASITRERSTEPAPVVWASLAAIACTRDLEIEARCRVYAAVERAAYALESKDRLGAAQALEHYGVLGEVIPAGEVDASTFAARLTALNPEEWARVAAAAPDANVAAVSPLVNAGDALVGGLSAHADAEAAVTWQALTALVQRNLLSPIKFAASFAPFASAVTIVKPRSLSPAVQRYLTAVGRLSAHQCSLLAEPWLLPDDVSNALSKAAAGGEARPAEESAALTALVTVPMRLTGDAGWAAAKTAAYGARVAACCERVSRTELEALWKPIERAVPITVLDAPPKQR